MPLPAQSIRSLPAQPLRPFIALVAAVSLLTACTPGRIDYRQVESAYDAGQDHWAPYNSSLRAEVSGNPFPISQDDFNKVVSEAIQPSGFPPSDTSAYRVRMIFNSPPTNGNYICEDHGQKGGAVGRSNGDTITIAAGYCRGTDNMTFLQGSISGITDPNDPRLKDFLRFIATQLFPLPQANDGSCLVFPC